MAARAFGQAFLRMPDSVSARLGPLRRLFVRRSVAARLSALLRLSISNSADFAWRRLSF